MDARSYRALSWYAKHVFQTEFRARIDAMAKGAAYSTQIAGIVFESQEMMEAAGGSLADCEELDGSEGEIWSIAIYWHISNHPSIAYLFGRTRIGLVEQGLTWDQALIAIVQDIERCAAEEGEPLPELRP